MERRRCLVYRQGRNVPCRVVSLALLLPQWQLAAAHQKMVSGLEQPAAGSLDMPGKPAAVKPARQNVERRKVKRAMSETGRSYLFPGQSYHGRRLSPTAHDAC